MGVIARDSSTTENFDLSALALEPESLRRIPRALALRHDILPVCARGNELTIALPDASDSDTIDRVRLVTGMHVRAITAPREKIRARLSEVYVQQTDEAPAIRALSDIYAAAVSAGASDIHVEPLASGGRVRRRVDGILHETNSLAPELHAQIISRIKLLAGMDIAERRQPQDGRYTFEAHGRAVDVRVSSIPTVLGEKLVIRLLDLAAGVPSLEALGMPAVQLIRLRRAIHAPHGFVVVCGPTGSGKTTTLYAAMAERNEDSQNLCSVEDPVEIHLPGVAQVQINGKAGLTFASALRAFLRQDANVIMVGEIRDEETAAISASAALGGQLVLATLHCNDAVKAIDRLVELGVARHTIAAGLSAVVAQRLVRRLCRTCRVPFIVNGAQFAGESGKTAFRAAGCRLCAGTGYVGRTAICESLFIDETLRAMILDGAPSFAVAQAAASHGYEGMIRHGIERVMGGETTFEELERVLVVEYAA